MREFKDTFTPKEGFASDQHRETDRPRTSETDSPRIPHNADLPVTPFTESSDAFSAIYKRYGLIDVSKSEKSEPDQPDASEGKDFSRYLEKREDGKCFNKENEKSYDSVEEWQQAQETLAKRYEGAASYFERKANKEWARYKNSEANGESDIEKWEHYRRSQEYYAKAKECTEKAETIRTRLNNEKTSADSGNDEKIADPITDTKETKTRELTDDEKLIVEPPDISYIEQASRTALLEQYSPKANAEDVNKSEISEIKSEGLTEEEKTKIKEETGWSDEIIESIQNMKQYEILKNADLVEAEINGKKCLIKENIDLDYTDEDGISNRDRIARGLAPLDSKTGKPIELHHLGQKAASPLVELTEEEHRTGEYEDGKKNQSLWHDNTVETKVHGEGNNWDQERKTHWKSRFGQGKA